MELKIPVSIIFDPEASKRAKISRNQNEGKLIFILLHDFVAMVFMMANTSPETSTTTTAVGFQAIFQPQAFNSLFYISKGY